MHKEGVKIILNSEDLLLAKEGAAILHDTELETFTGYLLNTFAPLEEDLVAEDQAEEDLGEMEHVPDTVSLPFSQKAFEQIRDAIAAAKAQRNS